MVKARLDFVINAIARQSSRPSQRKALNLSDKLYGDAGKARKDLHSFASANDPRLYKLVKACVDPQTDLKTLIRAKVSICYFRFEPQSDEQNELLRKLEQSHADVLDTFTVLVDNASWNIVNHTSIPSLIKRLQRPEGHNADNISLAAYRLLRLIAKECPPMYRTHVSELVIVMGDKKNDRLAEAALRGLAAVCKADPEAVPDDK